MAGRKENGDDEDDEDEEKKRREPRTAIQSTRPSCKHAECVRHQVVYMLKRTLPIRCLFGCTTGSRNGWSRTV